MAQFVVHALRGGAAGFGPVYSVYVFEGAVIAQALQEGWEEVARRIEGSLKAGAIGRPAAACLSMPAAAASETDVR